jgi:hypothetical protein
MPYYCALCGLGFGEVMACEEADCCLETKQVAEARARRRRPMTTAKPDSPAAE